MDANHLAEAKTMGVQHIAEGKIAKKAEIYIPEFSKPERKSSKKSSKKVFKPSKPVRWADMSDSE
jgi:hypothetical protein